MDGRLFLATTGTSYDLLLIDAYTNELQIPFHLATVEFFELTKKHLSPDGILAFNIALGGNSEIVQRMSQSVARVYDSVYLLEPAHGYNSLLVASTHAIDFSNLNEVYLEAQLPNPPDFTISQVESSEGAELFTDDKAPLELLTDLTLL